MTGGMSRKKIRLSQEALILYNWLCLNSSAGGAVLNGESFRKWFEDEIGKFLSPEQLSAAISELQEYQLISIVGWQIQPIDMDRQRFYTD